MIRECSGNLSRSSAEKDSIPTCGAGIFIPMMSTSDGTLAGNRSSAVLAVRCLCGAEASNYIDGQPICLRCDYERTPKECPECEHLDSLLMECMSALSESEPVLNEVSREAANKRIQQVLDEIRSHLTATPSKCGKLAGMNRHAAV